MDDGLGGESLACCPLGQTHKVNVTESIRASLGNVLEHAVVVQHWPGTDNVERLKLVDVNIELLAKNLDLELLVELQLHEMVKLCQESEEFH